MSDSPDQSPELSPEAHGVHGTQRGDSRMEEEPGDPSGGDAKAWADATETGGDAT